MGVWITRIDHFPPDYAIMLGRGRYPVVYVPCLYGLVMEPHTEGLREYVQQLQHRGFDVVGSQWGEALSATQAEAEADRAVAAVSGFGFDGWVMNGEKKYEGGGRSGAYARRFRRALPRQPFGWSPEPRLALDHEVLQELGVCYMPQAYPLENGRDVAYCIEWGVKFGYQPKNIVPLVGAYPVNGERYPASRYREQALAGGVPGLILYTGNQSADVSDYWRELVVR